MTSVIMLTLKSCVEVNENLFLTYKIYHKNTDWIRNSNGEIETVYYLSCKNEYGVFKINVTEETFKSKKINDYISFEGGISKTSLAHSYNLNDETKENISKTCDGLSRMFLKSESVLVLFTVLTTIFTPLASSILIINLKDDIDEY